MRHRTKNILSEPIRRISEALQISEGKARMVKALIAGKEKPQHFQAVKDLCRNSYQDLTEIELIQEAINEIIDGFGTDIIRGEFVNDFYQDMSILYVNLGIPNHETVCFDTREEKFFLGTWEDINTLKA